MLPSLQNPHFHTPIEIHAFHWMLYINQFFLICSLFSRVHPCSFYSHFNCSVLSLTLWLYAHLIIKAFVHRQHGCNSSRLPSLFVSCKSGPFSSCKHIAWSSKLDEKCIIGPGHDRKEVSGPLWPMKQTPVTVWGPLNESSLRVQAVGQVKVIAVKQAKPAGSAGASFHPGLTPSHDLLVLSLLAVLLLPFCLTLRDIPTLLFLWCSFKLRLCIWSHLPRLMHKRIASVV